MVKVVATPFTHARPQRLLVGNEPLIRHESRQPRPARLLFVPHGNRCPLNLMVFQVARRDAHPALRLELPTFAIAVGDPERAEVARIFGIGIYQVNVPGNFGQPGIQCIAVAVSAAAGLLAVATGKCRQQYDDKTTGPHER